MRENEDLELNKVYQMDCLEGMKKLENKSIDVVVTSPPYNIGVKYNEHDDNMSFDQYLDWLGSISKQIKKILKDDGSFFLNIGDKPSDEFRSFKVAETIDNHFKLQNTIHWIKSISIPKEEINVGHYKPVNSDRYLNNSHEYIFHFTKNGDVDLDKLAIGVPYADKSNIDRWDSAGQDKRDRGNNWYIDYETIHEKRAHPAVFPIELPKKCIKLHGIEEETTVLDPFMGSGTTALAAKQLNCKYLGFEIDEEYVKTAKDRLKQKKLT